MKIFGFIVTIALIDAFYAYDIRSEPADKRATICSDQRGACGTFCAFRVDKNTCNPDSMVWECVCAGGKVPQPTEITFPVPYFVCTGSQQECAANCEKNSPIQDNQACIDRCNLQFKCDNLDPKARKNVTATPPPTSNKRKDVYDDDESNAFGQSVPLLMLIGAAFIAF